MSRVTIKIKGLNQAQANIKQVVQNVEVGSEAALDKVSAQMLADDKGNCPVDTGLLRDNQQIFESHIGARSDRQVGSNVPYHWYVNDGTYKMAARPFTTNAFEANQGSLVPELRKMKVW